MNKIRMGRDKLLEVKKRKEKEREYKLDLSCTETPIPSGLTAG